MSAAEQIDVVAMRREAESEMAIVARLTGRIDAGIAILRGQSTLYPHAVPDEQKVFATVRACAALRGVAVIESRDDRGRPEWIASMGAWTKAFSDLDDLVRWVARLEGRKP